MAYMTEIQVQCQDAYCSKYARYEVRAYGNQPHGRYCKRHAEQRVRELSEAEANNPGGFR